MYTILAAAANQVTVGDVAKYLWWGFKALPVALYHLAVNHTAASLLQTCYVLGIILFWWLILVLFGRATGRFRTVRR